MKLKPICLTLGLSSAIAVAYANDDQVAKGKQLVEKFKCHICHAIDGKGGKSGKPMNGITEGKTDAYLKGSLLTPKETIDPKTKMPSYKEKMSDADVEAVIVYMKSLK